MTRMPDPNSIGDETLLRLAVAAALEFPDGSMRASGLRREAQHGRLRIWRIAGKDYTTKQALKEMRGQCVLSNHHDSSCAAPAKAAAPSGLSKTGSAKSAQALAKASAAKLRSRSRNTSSKIDNRSSATVIPIKS
jgi:hypothetical protein